MVQSKLSEGQVRTLSILLLFTVFVITVGLGFIVDNVSEDTHTTASIIERATSPESQRYQSAIIQTLIVEECETRYVVERFVGTVEPDVNYINRCVAEAIASIPRVVETTTTTSLPTVPK